MALFQVSEESEDGEWDQGEEDHTWVQEGENDGDHAEKELRDRCHYLRKERKALAADTVDKVLSLRNEGQLAKVLLELEATRLDDHKEHFESEDGERGRVLQESLHLTDIFLL